jgi:hypothetical protein
MCLANSQALIYEIANRKKLSLDLQSELAKGVVDLYSNGLSLAPEGLSKQMANETRVYFNNRRLFYAAQSFMKMKELTEETFKKTGEGYGKMISYMNAAYDSLAAGLKEIVLA